MIFLKTQEEIELLRESNRLVSGAWNPLLPVFEGRRHCVD